MQSITKNYRKWMKRKAAINNFAEHRQINEGDVVWTAVGENVGVEIDGKSDRYSRPVVVLRKHTAQCFTGVPLTSQPHSGSWYANFEFQGRKEYAALIQTRLFDTSRVYSRIGELSKKDYECILDSYVCLITKKMCPSITARERVMSRKSYFRT